MGKEWGRGGGVSGRLKDRGCPVVTPLDRRVLRRILRNILEASTAFDAAAVAGGGGRGASFRPRGGGGGF
eukprot:scaffold10715_cov114-Isochrysis_galbana.AAC.28